MYLIKYDLVYLVRASTYVFTLMKIIINEQSRTQVYQQSSFFFFFFSEHHNKPIILRGSIYFSPTDFTTGVLF